MARWAEFSRGNTCDECGTALKNSAALMSHRGSKPCQLAKVQKRMAAEGWIVCLSDDAAKVLEAAEIYYEKAPAAFTGGGVVREPGVPARFNQALLEEAIWCPAWAARIVTKPVSFVARVRVLRWAERQTNDTARSTVLALADLEEFARSLEEGDDGSETD